MEYDVGGLLLAFIRCKDRESREKLLDRWEEITGIAISEETKEEYKEWISRSYPVRRRSYSVRRRTSKWNDEKLKSYKDDVPSLRNALSTCEKSRREKLFARYTELTGIVVSEETEEERKARISKAHSKPSKWTDEKLKSYKDDTVSLRNDLSTCEKSRRERILNRFTELTGIDVTEETEEERKERISKAHSGEHKASKWNDERIMSYTCFEDLKKKTKNYKKPLRERVRNRWLELHNLTNEV